MIAKSQQHIVIKAASKQYSDEDELTNLLQGRVISESKKSKLQLFYNGYAYRICYTGKQHIRCLNMNPSYSKDVFSYPVFFTYIILFANKKNSQSFLFFNFINYYLKKFFNYLIIVEGNAYMKHLLINPSKYLDLYFFHGIN